MMLIKIYKKRQRKRYLQRILRHVFCDEETWLGDGFYVDLRNPQPDKQYISIGKHSVIDGTYIFETSSGHISIGNRVHIGGSTFISIDDISIGNDVTIAWGCLFYDHNSHSVDWNKRQYDTEREYQNLIQGRNSICDKDWSVVKHAPIKICDKAWIGEGCTILKGVTIGEGAVVGAGSVVVTDVEPWTVVRGNPAVNVRNIK